MKTDTRLERYLFDHPRLGLGDCRNGCFMVPCEETGATLFVIVSDGMGWDHVSVSVKDEERCPTWEEMCFIKGLWFEPSEVVIQYHPDERDYINLHEYCLHLWRPQKRKLPTPPRTLVGWKTREEARRLAKQMRLR